MTAYTGGVTRADHGRSLDEWRELWLRTRIRVRDCGRTVDLDDDTRRTDAGFAARLPLAVLTGWNPGAVARDRATNRAANRDLRARLDAARLDWRPALGIADDGSWSEPGFAVAGLFEADAVRLGAELGQLAVFRVTQTEVVVVATDGSSRIARARWASGSRPG